MQAALAERYHVHRIIGRGGMGTVFEAEDLKHHRQVAIKMLHPELAGVLGPERFLREIEIAASFTHPHIVPLHDSGAADGFLFYVMPFVDGESLRDRLDRETQLPMPDAVAIAKEVADALGYAHGHGVVHRDVKPENILIEGGHAVVTDFGIARAISSVARASLTEPGLAVGTPAYMSPEQAGGSGAIDGRSDQYALGCVLYEMLAGTPPFTGPTPQAIVARQLADSPPALHTVRTGLPSGLEAAISKALSKVPADRYPSMGAFAEALTRVEDGKPAPGRLGGRAGWFVAAAIALAGAYVLARGMTSADGRHAPAAGSPLSNIAVLYFDDLSDDKGLEHLASGLTEDLIDRLASVNALRVISPDGVRPFRGRSVPPDSVARALHVGTLVTGSLSRGAEAVRVSVRLADPATGVQLSSETFDEPSGNILAVRDRLAEEVARQLRVRLGREVQLHERRRGTTVPEAWDLVLRAEQLREQAHGLLLKDSTGIRSLLGDADSLLRKAERLDPAWPEPTTLRGWLTYDLSGWSLVPTDTTVPSEAASAAWVARGIALADRALRISASSPAALELRGTLRYRSWAVATYNGLRDTTGQLLRAEQDLRAAAGTLGSIRPRALSTLSGVLQFSGKLAEANLAARSAFEADAFLSDAAEIVMRLFETSLELRRYDDAQRWCDQGGGTFPRDWRFRMCQLSLQAWSPSVQPDLSRSWQLLGELDALATPDERPWLHPQMMLLVAAAAAAAGLPDSAEHVIAAANAAATADNSDMAYYEALARVRLGQPAAAARLLERLLRQTPNLQPILQSHPEFERLWSEPALRSLTGARVS